jgi:hypothetical protein
MTSIGRYLAKAVGLHYVRNKQSTTGDHSRSMFWMHIHTLEFRWIAIIGVSDRTFQFPTGIGSSTQNIVKLHEMP